MPQSTRPILVCPVCSSSFRPTLAQIRNGGGRYCSVRCYGKNKARPAEERFWGLVEKTDTCWIWKGHLGNHGYGVFSVAAGRFQTAHRLAWEFHHGKPVPDGLCVLHNCPGGDNRACVNPGHLWIGTRKDNNWDKALKGRSGKGIPCLNLAGEKHPGAKLTNEQVLEIRRLHTVEGIGAYRLGKQFGVSKPTVQRILRGKNWKHI